MIEKELLDRLIKHFSDFEKKLFREMNHAHTDNDNVQAYLLESEKIHQTLNQLANRLRMGDKQSGTLFSHEDKKDYYWKNLLSTINNVIHHIEKETTALEKMYPNQREFTFHPSHFDAFKYKLALRNELLSMKKQLHERDEADTVVSRKPSKA
ncbi:MAG: hypothetical protein A3F14_01820 [Gammaproteobacteria bacterium RIFCSPHIGHO2_12_FULL_43_28]|nr:MAG: hypothetical protein A3F14_01820 [Gammaproteobacteria bacterium RIFCSPHIGHO2_12_FULL_43_28]